MNTDFLKKMNDYFPKEYDAYIDSLSKPVSRGFIVNTLKTTVSDCLSLLPFPIEPSPFSNKGYRIVSDDAIGYSFAHIAGLLYSQEVSASSVVDWLDIQPGDIVLDCCSAPGGKTAQIGFALQQEGYLISNEFDRKRCHVLEKNVERLGLSNVIITNNDAITLCQHHPNTFDKILLDAPCSGEGMFKKADVVWSQHLVEKCAKQQKMLISAAYNALKSQGILVYSTCTFSKEENEEVIEYLLQQYDDAEIVPIKPSWGRNGFATSVNTDDCRRILPMDGGEGHFIAKIKKNNNNTNYSLKNTCIKLVPSCVKEFIEATLNISMEHVYCVNDKVYVSKNGFKDVKGTIVSNQVYLGDIVKNRFEPCHFGFMSSYLADKWKQKVEVTLEQARLFRRGETLAISDVSGYAAVSYKKSIIGFVKGDTIVCKNKLPKGLRYQGGSYATETI